MQPLLGFCPKGERQQLRRWELRRARLPRRRVPDARPSGCCAHSAPRPRRLAEREKELDALRASGAAPAGAPPESTAVAVADVTARLEAKWAGLLDSLQSEWALERARLEAGLERERLAAAEAASKAAGERARLVKLAESRIGELTHKVSKDVVATSRQCVPHPRRACEPPLLLALHAATARHNPHFRPHTSALRSRPQPPRAHTHASHPPAPLTHTPPCHVTCHVINQAAGGAAAEG